MVNVHLRANYIVTAVIVAHDGGRWLPEAVAALRAQTRPVQRVVGVDTGSRDRSGAVLAELLGAGSVFGTDRGTGFGAAVTQALRHRAANVPVNPPGGLLPAQAQDAVEWIWLLHDDCAPERDALEQLLLVAAERRFAVLGPKVRKWDDPRVLIEAGLRIDRAGRRVTGLDPDEYDQGQHDGDRDVLAVGSAGMLVRRDVWDGLGGFDPALPPLHDDIDFCWRVNAAGHRVRLVTGAVIRHAEATATCQWTVPAGGLPAASRLRRARRRSGLYVLFANLPLGPMLVSVLGNTAGSLLRAALALLVVKRPAAAWDEMAAPAAVLGRPLRLLLARRRRPSGRRRTYRLFRSSLPRGGVLALFTETRALAASRSGRREISRAHLAGSPEAAPAGVTAAVDAAAGDQAAVEEPAAADGGLPAGSRFARRIMTSPGVLTAALLALITVVAARSLLGGGPLGGGALVPAWGGASSLWQEYLTGFHDVGVGSAAAAPPYVAVLAAVATVLGGKPWLAVDLLLLGSVPLAGITAYLAARRITGWVPARVWAAASYALLPAATGAVAAGRIGTAVTIALIPLIGILAARMLTQPGRQARRAAWAAGLTVAAAAAFVPLAWALAAALVVLAAPGVFALGRNRRATAVNLAIVAAAPAALLFPWTLQLFAHPSLFLAEAGIPRPGLSDPALPASSLLLLSPGGPGVPPVWVTAGLGTAGLAALLTRRHRALVAAGWGAALSGMLFAIVVSRLSAVPPGAGQAVHGWPGVPLMLAAAGVLLAAAAAGESLPALLRHSPAEDRATRHIRGPRRLPGPPRIPGLRRIPGPRAIPGFRRIPGFRAIPRPDVPGLRAIPGLDSIRGLSDGWVPLRRTCAALAALAACSAPVLAAGAWIARGAGGPLTRADFQVLPALVSAAPGSGARPGTLVLRPGPGHLTYTVLHGTAPLPGDPQLPEPSAARHRLDGIVAGLTSGHSGDVGADGRALASFGIGYVVLPSPAGQGLSRLLDGTPGLRQLSTSSAFALWSVTGVTARVRVIEPDGAVVPVPSGAVNVEGAAAPGPGGTLVLAEPADAGWHASLNGQPLTPLSRPADGWAQAFQLPAGGGKLDVTRDMAGHHLSVLAEGLALLLVAGLALPGLPAPGPGDGIGGPGPAAPHGARTRARRKHRSHSARRAHGAHGRGGRPSRRTPERVAAPGAADAVTGHDGELR